MRISGHSFTCRSLSVYILGFCVLVLISDVRSIEMLENYVVILRVRRQGGKYRNEYFHRYTYKEVSHGHTIGR
jgi:hypothetical protein